MEKNFTDVPLFNPKYTHTHTHYQDLEIIAAHTLQDVIKMIVLVGIIHRLM